MRARAAQNEHILRRNGQPEQNHPGPFRVLPRSDLFAGQLTLAQLRLVELQSVVQLYRALGGGWQ